jgi:gamma-glutamyltranspeptidase / glutathione hydrolase
VLEKGRFPAATVEALKARGHTSRGRADQRPAGLMQRTPQGWFGGADPRREGVAVGD